jgi:hypothetical protein
MKSALGQVAVALIVVGALPQQVQAQPDSSRANLIAANFLAALDRNDVGTASQLAAPNVSSAMITGILNQRATVPSGPMWGAGRQQVQTQPYGTNAYMFTYRTTYRNATKLQRVVVDCASGCKVSAFNETAAR